MIATRSALFAPGTRADLVAKAGQSGADLVIVDLEDTVPEAEKPQARVALHELLAFEGAQTASPDWYVRTNPVGTEHFTADVRAASDAGAAGIVVPKMCAAQAFSLAEAAQCPEGGALPVIAGVETAAGVASVEDLIAGPVVGVYFGADDFVADMGGVRTLESSEVLYARSRVALAARVAGALTLDQVVFAVDDERAFRDDARTGAAIGYSGKMCIHPRQVGWANEVFSPSVDAVAWARRALAAYAEAEHQGEGVATLDGNLIDMPAVRKANMILARSGE